MFLGLSSCFLLAQVLVTAGPPGPGFRGAHLNTAYEDEEENQQREIQADGEEDNAAWNAGATENPKNGFSEVPFLEPDTPAVDVPVLDEQQEVGDVIPEETSVIQTGVKLSTTEKKTVLQKYRTRTHRSLRKRVSELQVFLRGAVADLVHRRSC